MAKEFKELTREEVAAEEDALMDFQFALIDAMRERGMTKADLAKALGVTRARVSQLFSAEANPTIKLAARALRIVGLKNSCCPINVLGHEDVSNCDETLTEISVEKLESAWEVVLKPASDIYRPADAAKWFACQHHESFATWYRKEGDIANTNEPEAMEAA